MAVQWVATDFGGLEVLDRVEVDVPAPREGEVRIEVRAAGMNPADYKYFAAGSDRSVLPMPIGLEVAGVISAVGPNTQIASGGGAIGDEVLAYRVSGGYTSSLTVAAGDVFAKPENLSFAEAANLLLAGATASEMLHVTGVAAGDTILVHGASGAVGVSVIQQAKLLGARVIGTASAKNFSVVERFGAEPVAYGDGLEQRVRELAPDGVNVALDTVGTDEAVRVSLALVGDLGRIVTIAAAKQAAEHGFRAIGASMPASAAYRSSIRSHLIQLTADGSLVVPVARTFPLSDAIAALELLKGEHPGGKLALIP
ncbi:MAG TPA: NADP-dependent oxidoreductase [Microbacteriaceae bacterium]|jgi:NADPH:quinone reductase-like Zn-dependent oxidoreductase|nr:NADP-dependent oxidoreductase [Microbacteriaceae bacterium]